jgi:hypothetical protein
MGVRPEFIPAEVFRQYLSPTQLNRYFSVDNMYASSYVARCVRINKPIKAKHRLLTRYRPIDVIARARADACKVERTGNNKLLHDYTVYKNKIAELKVEIAELENRKARSTHTLSLDILSNRITSRDMLLEEEIVAGAQGYEFACGVYFLVHAGAVVYVGQSINVYARVHSHRQEGRKSFDSFAFTPCEKEELDMLESLYIHAMCPSEQGRSTHGNLTAPYSMRQMIALGKRKKYTRNQQLLENVNE